MFTSGETAYYRRPEDHRAQRCEIISYADGYYTVKGMRTATCSRRPVLTIPEQYLLPVSVVRPEKKYRREFHGRGLSVPVSESLQRKEATEARLGMSEGSVLQCRAMTSLKNRIVRSLASKNRIPSKSQDFAELESEFLVAALSALRTVAAKAATEDIKQFKRFLAGSEKTEVFFCRIVLNIARTGKTAVVRFLQHRQQYHMTHVDIHSLRRLAA